MRFCRILLTFLLLLALPFAAAGETDLSLEEQAEALDEWRTCLLEHEAESLEEAKGACPQEVIDFEGGGEELFTWLDDEYADCDEASEPVENVKERFGEAKAAEDTGTLTDAVFKIVEAYRTIVDGCD